MSPRNAYQGRSLALALAALGSCLFSLDRLASHREGPPPHPRAAGYAASGIRNADAPWASPFAFVENRGQWDARTRYVASQAGWTVFVDERGWILDRAVGGERLALRIGVEGCSPQARLEPGRVLPGRHHFLRGRDSGRWQRSLAGHSELTQRGVREGVDLRLYERDGTLEYDLLLDPGTALDEIVLYCKGAEGLRLDGRGALLIETALGIVRQERPRTWEILPGGEERALECEFRLLGENRWGFRAPQRDERLALVVDPGLVWSSFLGGSADEFGWRIARAASGDLMLCGVSTSADLFPSQLGRYQPSFQGTSDVYVACLSGDGSTLRWASYLGGGGGEGPFDMEFGPGGELYLVGGTRSSDFPTTAGAYATSYNGSRQSGFLSVLDASGSQLLYSSYLGGTDEDWILDAALDSSGAATVLGITSSTDFPTTTGVVQPGYGGGATDLFVARLAPTGAGAADLLWSSYLGGSAEDGSVANAFDLAAMEQAELWMDPSGSPLLIAARTLSTDLTTSAGALQPQHAGGGFSDVYIARLDPLGRSLLWSTFLGGNDEELVGDLDVDGQGEIVLSGSTHSTDFPVTATAYDTSYGGLGDAFAARIDAAGTRIDYATYLGGSNRDECLRSLVDHGGLLTMLLRTESSDFPTTPGAYDAVHGGPFGEDVALARLRLGAGAGALHYASFVGGSLGDTPIDGVWDGRSQLIFTGYTISSDYPTTSGAWSSSFAGGYFDTFVTELELLPDGVVLFGTSSPGCSGPIASGVAAQARVGEAGFALHWRNAPASATGLVLLGGARLAAALPVLGFDLWLDPQGLLLSFEVASDARGFAEAALPIPGDPSLRGARLFAQSIWPSPCAPQGFASSDVLDLTVR